MSDTEGPKTSVWTRVISTGNAIGTIIAVVAVLKIVRQNMPNLAFRELLSFLVATYQNAIYPVFDFLFGWAFDLIDFRLTDFARDISTVYLILAAALFRGGFYPRLRSYYFQKNASPLRQHLVAVAMSLAAMLWVVVIPLATVMAIRRGQSIGASGFKSWAKELALICGGVVVAMLANLVV